jgi:hypothetical protein
LDTFIYSSAGSTIKIICCLLIIFTRVPAEILISSLTALALQSSPFTRMYPSGSRSSVTIPNSLVNSPKPFFGGSFLSFEMPAKTTRRKIDAKRILGEER